MKAYINFAKQCNLADGAGDDLWWWKWSDRNKDFRGDMDGVDEARGYAEHAFGVRVSPA
jgi:hypothetical protein